MSEVMSLEDMDPGLRSGQVWKWKSPLGHEGLYFLLYDVSQEYEAIWHAIDLNNGQIKCIYSVGLSTSWSRLV